MLAVRAPAAPLRAAATAAATAPALSPAAARPAAPALSYAAHWGAHATAFVRSAPAQRMPLRALDDCLPPRLRPSPAALPLLLQAWAPALVDRPSGDVAIDAPGAAAVDAAAAAAVAAGLVWGDEDASLVETFRARVAAALARGMRSGAQLEAALPRAERPSPDTLLLWQIHCYCPDDVVVLELASGGDVWLAALCADARAAFPLLVRNALRAAGGALSLGDLGRAVPRERRPYPEGPLLACLQRCTIARVRINPDRVLLIE